MQRNIDTAGRVARGFIAVLLIIGAVFSARFHWWLSAVFVVSGLFVLFEAARGWCALRACGIRTRL